jgi:hypothetical protein
MQQMEEDRRRLTMNTSLGRQNGGHMQQQRSRERPLAKTREQPAQEECVDPDCAVCRANATPASYESEGQMRQRQQFRQEQHAASEGRGSKRAKVKSPRIQQYFEEDVRFVAQQ